MTDILVSKPGDTPTWPDDKDPKFVGELTATQLYLLPQDRGFQDLKLVAVDQQGMKYLVSLDNVTLQNAIQVMFENEKVNSEFLGSVKSYFTKRFNWNIS